MDLDMLDHAENLCHFEVMISTGLIRGNTKIGPVLEVWVSHRLYRSRNEIRVVSMKNDGSQSWIVLSKGMNKYVDKFHEENEEYANYEEMVTNTVSCDNTKGTINSTITLFSKMLVPVDQRKWSDILAIDFVNKRPYAY